MKQILLSALLLLSLLGRSQPPLAQRLDSLTQAYAENGFHGVILVAKNNQVLFEKGYGYANFDRRLPHTPATLFKTESVGKMFTATAILQLVEAGKLQLSQTVADLLPALRIRNATRITVDHLLKHTSGLQSPWDHPQWRFGKAYSTAELMKVVEEVPLAFDTPGQRMHYSNSGYCVLGWIVEKISGLSFDRYLQTHFFSPLNMTSIRHLNDTLMPVQGGAQPYRLVSSKRWVTLNRTLGPKAGAAGGWLSTAHDLYRFVQALNNGTLLKPETLQMMRTANNTAPKDSAFRYYAYGLETFANGAVPGATLYGHNGGGAGFSIDAFVDAQSGYIVVSCTNLHQNSRPIAYNYFRAALGQPLSPVAKLQTVKVYDLVDSIGLAAFLHNDSESFASLGIKPNPRLLLDLSEAADVLNDTAAAAQWLALAQRRFPQDGFVWMTSGDRQAGRGNKAEARSLFEKARTIAETAKDERMLQAVKEKLAAL